MQIVIFPLATAASVPSAARLARIKIAEAEAPRTDHDVYALNDLPLPMPSGETPHSRFRVLVNGFADDASFPTLDAAVKSIPDSGVEGSSFEIYDASGRKYVWTRQRRKASSAWSPFSIRVNGHPNGQSFASLDEAIDALSGRPPGSECEVFEAETCVFALSAPRARKIAEAL